MDAMLIVYAVVAYAVIINVSGALGITRSSFAMSPRARGRSIPVREDYMDRCFSDWIAECVANGPGRCREIRIIGDVDTPERVVRHVIGYAPKATAVMFAYRPPFRLRPRLLIVPSRLLFSHFLSTFIADGRGQRRIRGVFMLIPPSGDVLYEAPHLGPGFMFDQVVSDQMKAIHALDALTEGLAQVQESMGEDLHISVTERSSDPQIEEEMSDQEVAPGGP